ncbi:alpha/beta fold family hydrolase [Purpureocillium lavendulum]|uniref:Alpha/beta fold family hydrolase n=1 Tax=Purpureocillium lavendulum TaxID=1247861 RepID=A0AB34FMS6_9HYPO|nr:alpha/beta fold family hydrolase [Purpureocillium lavendulum]
MSRVTAPVSKLARAIGASAGPLRDTSASAHGAGAALMPKYAELLRTRRSSEHSDSSRGLTTTHRPTPQPSIANRSKPLMQTFHSSSPSSSASAAHLDAAFLPSMADLAAPSASAASGPRVPLLPDNYSAAHAADNSDATVQLPEVSIVAADPENVLPGTPLSEVEGLGLDGVELKFVHEGRSRHVQELDSESQSGGMLRDLWKGMVDDVLGSPKRTA